MCIISKLSTRIKNYQQKLLHESNSYHILIRNIGYNLWASHDSRLLLDSLSNMIPSNENDAGDSPKIHKDDPNC